MNVDIKEKLYKSISEYCRTNHLVIKDYINDLLNKSFMRDKYGDRPFVSERPVEVEIEVKKNEETKEYEVKMKETTIPIETDIKPQISSNEIIPIDLPMKEPDKKDLEEIKNQDTVIVLLEAKDKTDEDSEPVEEKPKRRKLK